MRLASLFSGGKDSSYATYLMEQQGHSVDYLLAVLPSQEHSWVFHTLNLHLLPLMAKAMGKELLSTESDGSEEGDLESLASLIGEVEVEGIVTGALASDYQWDRINGVCDELDIPVYSPLWRKDQRLLMEDMLTSGLRFVIVGVYAEGLGPEWLGRVLDPEAMSDLEKVAIRYGINISGEGGEYETLVLDSPLHIVPIVVEEYETRLTRDGGRLLVTRASPGDPNRGRSP